MSVAVEDSTFSDDDAHGPVRPEDVEEAKQTLPQLQASLENVVSAYLTHYVRGRVEM